MEFVASAHDDDDDFCIRHHIFVGFLKALGGGAEETYRPTFSAQPLIIQRVFFFAEHNFYMFSASTIAAASIAASLNGMNWHMRTGIQYDDLLQRLAALTGVKQVRGNTRGCCCCR